MKSVNLLGRGPSLQYLNTLPTAELVILGNDFDTEITQIKELRDYLKRQTIHLVLNMVRHNADGYNSINFFTEFNVVKLIRPYLNGIRVPGSSGQSIPLEENFLGDNHKEYMFEGGAKYPYDYAGTGIAAFAYTILDTKADVINIVGLDFYDNLDYGNANYLVKDKDGRDFIRDFWRREDMQENVCNLVKGNPNVTVNLHTICKNFIGGMEDIENLNIIKY
jgi:hypothetical protein